MESFEIMVMTAFGLEAVTAKELRELGYEDLKLETGRILFQGGYEAICEANLWLRTADRVLIRIGSFKALSFTDLFEGTKSLPWDQWLPKEAEFPVVGKSVRSKLHSVPDCQSIVKKAIVEKLKEKHKISWFEETGPCYRIEIGMLKDEATLSLDTTGVALHKRGYRTKVSQAPLRETLAAAMVLLSGWKPGRTLLDPFCGSGTIPIEAAMIGMNRAPGIHRSFLAEEWTQIPDSLWESSRKNAENMIKKEEFRVLGSDIDQEVLKLARFHSAQAQVEDRVAFQKLPVAEVRSSKKYGYLITNPPYGERMGEAKEIEKLYREMGRVFQTLDTWSYYILSPQPSFEEYFGRKADKRRKLYNGMIACQLYQYYGPKPPHRGDRKRENKEA